MLINTSSFKTICNKLVIKLEATVGPHGGKGIPRLDSYGDLLTEKFFVVLILYFIDQCHAWICSQNTYCDSKLFSYTYYSIK